MPELQNEPLTFEKVWAALMENREQQKETDRIVKEVAERQKKTDLQIEEAALQIEKTAREIGNLGNSFGELAEHLVAPGIVDKFNDLGFDFDDISPSGRAFKDPKTRQFLAEVDIVLENSEMFIAIEVKSKLNIKDVNKHLAHMEVLRRIADSKKDNRKYLGAVAGAVMTNETRSYAYKSGFFVIEQSGETMKIDIPEGFTPREW